MNGSLVGAGVQAILNLKPRFYWDAKRAQHAIGAAKAGAVPMDATVYETTAQASTAQWLILNSQKQWKFMTDDISTTAGKESCLGSVGAFYAGNANYHGGYTSSKYGYAVVAPTDAGQLAESGSVFPDVARDPDIATSRRQITLDTSLDVVNDCVIERSNSRSGAYVRTFQILVRHTDVLTPSASNFTMGWNDTADTRTTVAPTFRQLNDNTHWYVASIDVPAGGASTTGYLSVSAKADTGVWEIAFPQFFGNYTTMERVVRAGLCNTSTAREKYGVKTTTGEVCLAQTGWVAMSLVLPDRSIDNGHLDILGNSNYKSLGMLNLDCDTWRLRIAMSDAYEQVVVSLGDTSAVNFAFLNGLADWNDFQAMGLVAVWYHGNQHRYCSLFVNGMLCDSIADPAVWFPEITTPGIMHIGLNGEDGTMAESFISHVAYGMSRMHRSTARVLSRHMMRMARGGVPMSYVDPSGPPPVEYV